MLDALEEFHIIPEERECLAQHLPMPSAMLSCILVYEPVLNNAEYMTTSQNTGKNEALCWTPGKLPTVSVIHSTGAPRALIRAALTGLSVVQKNKRM